MNIIGLSRGRWGVLGKRCIFSVHNTVPSGRRTYSADQRDIHPLRILFCGSDHFSAYSLDALADLPPNIVRSIDVVCRTGKYTGRGLKHFTNPHIFDRAIELNLPVHQIDTFSGWNPPSSNGEPIDLIIAVSFGLLVPPRLLSSATYGGLNIHPSFLPDLRGAAPIHWSLIHGDTHSGVTLQTLHPSKFDHGTIIDQTPLPGLSLPPLSDPLRVANTISLLGRAGASMLTNNLLNGTFTTPHSRNPSPLPTPHHPPRLAPKVTRSLSQLNPSWTSTQLLNHDAAVRPLFDETTFSLLASAASATSPKAAPQQKRMHFRSWHDVTSAVSQSASSALTHPLPASSDTTSSREKSTVVAGLALLPPLASATSAAAGKTTAPPHRSEDSGQQPPSKRQDPAPRLVFRTTDGRYLAPAEVKVEGEGWRDSGLLAGRAWDGLQRREG